MATTTTEIGKKGEDIACEYLESKGYTILERNYHFEKAEVDIVSYIGRKIVFVEVKLRSSTKFGEPEEFVDEAKQKLVFKAAEAWLYERKMEGAPSQFDVIAIVASGDEVREIKHFERAF